MRNIHLASIEPITYAEWLDNKYNQTIQTKNYNIEQVQKVKMLGISESNWDASPQTFNFINKSL